MYKTLPLPCITSLLLSAAALLSCSGSGWEKPEAGDGDEPQKGVCHVEWAGTRAGAEDDDYKSTTYRLMVYGQPDAYKNEYVYVTDGSYCNPSGHITHLEDDTRNWLTPCQVKTEETGPGTDQYRYIYDEDGNPGGYNVQAGVVFSNEAQYTDPKDNKQHYYSYNYKAFKMVIASAAIPVTEYGVTVTDGDNEYVVKRHALVIRRDIGSGDAVAISPMVNVNVHSSYAGGNDGVEYVYTLPATELRQQRCRITVSIACDPLLGEGHVTGTRFTNVLQQGYYLPDMGLYDETKGIVTASSDAVMEKDFDIIQKASDDPYFPYADDEVYLISKDYGATRTDDEGRTVSACEYPSLEVRLGEAWVPIPLNINLEPQQRYHIGVIINKVHITVLLQVCDWELPAGSDGQRQDMIKDYPVYKVGTLSLEGWDSESCTFTIDDRNPGMVWTDPSGIGRSGWDSGGGGSGIIDKNN